jgi:uncharacterized protein YjbI with pentapeptide repeats
MQQVDLSGVEIRGAYFNGTRISGAEFCDVEISGGLENVVVNAVNGHSFRPCVTSALRVQHGSIA